jgi:chromosome segregation ATPase
MGDRLPTELLEDDDVRYTHEDAVSLLNTLKVANANCDELARQHDLLRQKLEQVEAELEDTREEWKFAEKDLKDTQAERDRYREALNVIGKAAGLPDDELRAALHPKERDE